MTFQMNLSDYSEEEMAYLYVQAVFDLHQLTTAAEVDLTSSILSQCIDNPLNMDFTHIKYAYEFFETARNQVSTLQKAYINDFNNNVLFEDNTEMRRHSINRIKRVCDIASRSNELLMLTIACGTNVSCREYIPSFWYDMVEKHTLIHNLLDKLVDEEKQQLLDPILESTPFFLKYDSATREKIILSIPKFLIRT